MKRIESLSELGEYLYGIEEEKIELYRWLYEKRYQTYRNSDDVWVFLCELDRILMGNNIFRILEEEGEDFVEQLSLRYRLSCIDGLENSAFALGHESTLEFLFPDNGRGMSEMLSIYALMRSNLSPCKKNTDMLPRNLLYPVFLRSYRSMFPPMVRLEHANIVYPYKQGNTIILFPVGEAGEDMFEQVREMYKELISYSPRYKTEVEISGLSYPNSWSEQRCNLYQERLHRLMNRKKRK